MKSSRKETSSRKRGLEYLLGIIETSLSQYFFLILDCHTNDIKWHSLLSFSCIKKIYFIYTNTILNRGIIFCKPLNFFLEMTFLTFKN